VKSYTYSYAYLPYMGYQQMEIIKLLFEHKDLLYFSLSSIVIIIIVAICTIFGRGGNKVEIKANNSKNELHEQTKNDKIM